jgi:hypothetical protein
MRFDIHKLRVCHGEIKRFCAASGLSRPAVIDKVCNGALIVDPETRQLVEAPPPKRAKVTTGIDWRFGPTPAYGALKRGCAGLGYSVNGLYAALRRDRKSVV